MDGEKLNVVVTESQENGEFSDEDDKRDEPATGNGRKYQEDEDMEEDARNKNVDNVVVFTDESSNKSRRNRPLSGIKQYINTSEPFVVGVDPLSQESKAKAEERIRRFGQVVRPEDIITKETLQKLYKSLGVKGPKAGHDDDDDDDGDDSDDNYVRYEAIHIRGTDELSTQDVFNYFVEFVPPAVEWIDDQSCNVVWMEKLTAARALLKLSVDELVEGSNEGVADVTMENNKRDEGDKQIDDNENKMEVDDDAVHDDDDEETENSGNKRGNKHSNGPPTANVDKNINGDDDDNNSKNIPPKGKWRLGKPHQKYQHRIVMRFATTDDKKVSGANEKSRYYQIHGNPNYEGLRGLITKGCKQRIMKRRHVDEGSVARRESKLSERKRKGAPDVPDKTKFDKHVDDAESRNSVLGRINRKRSQHEEDSGDNDDSDDERDEFRSDRTKPRGSLDEDILETKNHPQKPKMPRMRMYADEEEQEPSRRVDRRDGGVWSRLGQSGRDSHPKHLLDDHDSSHRVGDGHLRRRQERSGSSENNKGDLRDKLKRR